MATITLVSKTITIPRSIELTTMEKSPHLPIKTVLKGTMKSPKLLSESNLNTSRPLTFITYGTV